MQTESILVIARGWGKGEYAVTIDRHRVSFGGDNVLDWLVFCEYGFHVSALWCPLATPPILLGFLLPWAWCISSLLLQQSPATAPYLGWGVSPHHCPSWHSTWDSSSRPSCAHSATAPWTLGCSSWPLPLVSGAASGLGHRVAPPGRCPWPQMWGGSSRLLPVALNMPANLENSAVAIGLEKVSFHSNPKERQCKRMFKLPHNCTHLTC